MYVLFLAMYNVHFFAPIFKKFIFKDFIYFIFREREREGERGEKYQCVVASHMAPTGNPATTQACALTGNRASDSLVCSPCSVH